MMSSEKNEESLQDLNPLGFVFPCIFPECCRKFIFRRTLGKHINEHLNKDDTLRCPHCGVEGLCNRSAMVEHVWSCNGSHPYICPFVGCTYGAAKKVNLKNHLEKDHQFSVRLYIVDICPFFWFIDVFHFISDITYSVTKWPRNYINESFHRTSNVRTRRRNQISLSWHRFCSLAFSLIARNNSLWLSHWTIMFVHILRTKKSKVHNRYNVFSATRNMIMWGLSQSWFATHVCIQDTNRISVHFKTAIIPRHWRVDYMDTWSRKFTGEKCLCSYSMRFYLWIRFVIAHTWRCQQRRRVDQSGGIIRMKPSKII